MSVLFGDITSNDLTKIISSDDANLIKKLANVEVPESIKPGISTKIETKLVTEECEIT
jgi:hypothetical protein